MNNVESDKTQNQYQNYINVVDRHSKKYNIFLDNTIGEPSEYREFLTVLLNANNVDNIYIYINSYGGNLDTTLSLIEGVKMSMGKVSAVLMGPCHSAASILALNCDELIILDNAYAMIHTASMGYYGKVDNVKSHTDFAAKQLEKLIDSTYKGFLSDEEISKVKNGTEFWFAAKELRKRVKNRYKLLKKELDKSEKK